MIAFLKNLFKKRRENNVVNARSRFRNKGVNAISNIKGVDIKQFGDGEYGICVDMSECPLTPGELIQKLIEGQENEH